MEELCTWHTMHSAKRMSEGDMELWGGMQHGLLVAAALLVGKPMVHAVERTAAASLPTHDTSLPACAPGTAAL